MLAAAIAQYLHNQGVVVYEPDGGTGNILADMMPPAPDEFVMVEQTPGADSSAKLGYDGVGIHFIIRGTVDPRTAAARAQSIYGALQGLRSVTLPGGIYLVLCVMSPPGHIGADDTQRHEYSLNGECQIRNLTTHRE